MPDSKDQNERRDDAESDDGSIESLLIPPRPSSRPASISVDEVHRRLLRAVDDGRIVSRRDKRMDNPAYASPPTPMQIKAIIARCRRPYPRVA